MPNRIKELREKKGLSQRQLATIIGVSNQTIMNWENEEYTHRLVVALRLAKYFKTTVERLFDGTE